MKNSPFHLLQWQYDLLGGQEIEQPVCGALDGAVYVCQGGKITIPQAAGGGRVRHFRGAWDKSVEFTWDGYWALPRGNPTNYFTGGTVENEADQTVITLGTDPGDGAELQVYYYFATGQTFAPKTPIEAYPCFIPCRQGAKAKFSSAPDADQWIALAMLEARARWDDFKRCYGWSIIESLKAFGQSPDQSIIDNFNRDPSRVRDEGHWTFSGSSAGSSITPAITEDGQLRLIADVKDGGWGYFGWGMPIFIPDQATMLKVLFKGRASGLPLRFAINTRVDGAYDLSRTYYAGVVDDSENWRLLELDWPQWSKIDRLIWDGERIDWPIWWIDKYYNSGWTNAEISKHYAGWVEDGYRHHQALRLDMVHVIAKKPNWERVALTMPFSQEIFSGTAGISFGCRWIQSPRYGVHYLTVDLVSEYAPHTDQLWQSKTIYAEELANWKRINLLWSDFFYIPPMVPVGPVNQLRFTFHYAGSIQGSSTIWQDSSTALLDDFNWIPLGKTTHERETLKQYLED
ncbi:MAG: hypothetical protein WHT06_16210 [Desulfobacterales bacterium]